ncbi:uncharacterized protein LOC103309677 [Acyrthosiphon pisum]|uniref:MULE transposase domain-containing protein n=1 Tax=Acyrthosiphon pisum TaxID=7029 RepID=A0A8R2FAN8_ACYPI|nr:uncharacterized protein LOC103309677 [Acyrthosiphon pisum]|eukprot:XP_008183967.1 PREDICTED: uncharacterized protein LOC103309677 [Acyrthosiphon pisum]
MSIRGHNHDQDLQSLKLKQFKEKLVFQSTQQVKPLTVIYDEEARNFPEASAMYAQRSAESLMRRARKSSLPLIPDTLRQLGDLFEQGNLNRYQVNDEIIYKGCVEDTHGNYSIIFASQIMTNNALSICKRELHADCTFRITPSKPKSYQLLVLHGISIPLVYVLMESKNKSSYQSVISFIKSDILPNFRPRKIMTDYESSLRSALVEQFPTAKPIGCWFHHNQAVWKKMKTLGYLNLVHNNENARNILRQLLVLPLLPAQKIVQGFRIIKRLARRYLIEMNTLFDYYERFWIHRVGVEIISVYGQARRTNNHIESFHNKLRYSFGVAHPNIWVFLNKLCDLIKNYNIVINQLQNGLTPTRNTRSRYIANSDRIQYATRQLNLGLINTKEFLSSVLTQWLLMKKTKDILP